MNYKLIEENIKNLKDNLTQQEIFKLMRELLYEQISYYGDNDKGIIYNGDYSQINIEQATIINNKIRGYIGIYSQIICNKREFSEDYLESNGVYKNG